MIQTSEPGHHAIQAIVRGDPRFFLEREIELRRELGYPPFAELVKLAGPEVSVRSASDAAREGGATVLGPIEIPSRNEHESLVKTADAQALVRSLRPLLGSREAAGLRVDPDPR
jgi:primosomal protein N' (replication factor Y)